MCWVQILVNFTAGHKFLGSSVPGPDRYRACVPLKEQEVTSVSAGAGLGLQAVCPCGGVNENTPPPPPLIYLNVWFPVSGLFRRTHVALSVKVYQWGWMGFEVRQGQSPCLLPRFLPW